ncbi:unnamed protein product, partial [Dracunculus medinensis]|uniref:G_PROTEIN_RECEP_F1_2 domain-containing protein n=1 Tax=Dracunculus medinensis TaxID=318479 RepID=A0A0N4UQC7_DRAME
NCSCGIIVNLCLITVIWKTGLIKKPFGVLSISIGSLNCSIVLVTSFYNLITFSFEMLINSFQLNRRQITKEKSANGIGQLINGIYYSNLLLHLLISVNRFYSVAFPLKYGTIFDRKKTKIMVFLIITIWSLSSFLLCVYIAFSWFINLNLPYTTAAFALLRTSFRSRMLIFDFLDATLIAPFCTTAWGTFILFTFTWMLCHFLDG